MNIRKAFTALTAFYAANPPAIIATSILIVALVVGGALLWAFHQTDSALEIKAGDARLEAINANSQATAVNMAVAGEVTTVNAAASKVKTAEKALGPVRERKTKAEANVQAAREPVANVNYEAANKERCLAYPEDCPK